LFLNLRNLMRNLWIHPFMPWKKLSIALLILLVISQLPFAYRRYRLGRLNATILQLNSQRVPPQVDGKYKEYKGVVHVHSFLGGHSYGSFQEIIEAAKANELHFVVMTEHPAKEFNTAELTLKGLHGGVLFVNGNEVSTREGNRLLVIPGGEATGKSGEPTMQSVLEEANARYALTVVAYPREFKSWAQEGYGAIEVYNVFTNTRQINSVVLFFDTLWSSSRYHDLLFANFYTRPAEALEKWDTANGRQKVTGLAGNDAHANIGLSLNDSSGKPILGLKLDPYETSFRLVRVHLLAPADTPLSEEVLVEALARGHCFVGFDLFGDTSGFSFSATNSTGTWIQGDEITLNGEVRLQVLAPIPGRIVLFHDGKAVQEEYLADKKEFLVNEKGSYRVEVYLPQLAHRVREQPWIISNPIYVR
jgi:hypothetical protein